MNLLRFLLRLFLLPIVDGEGGGAPVIEAPPIEPAAPAAPAAPVVDAPAEQPKTMGDALNQHWTRDEKGRFAAAQAELAAPAAIAPPAVAAAPKPAAAVPAAPAVPAVPAAEDDITALPEGLGQKAQERFQKLATANRELSTRFEQADRQVAYVRDTFQQHGIRQEQFEQAVGFISAMNRGDLRGALALIDEQRAQIAMALGEPVPGVDVLAGYPDLRTKVDGLQLSEQDAIEIARLRRSQGAVQQQAQQRQQQEQQTATAERDFQTARGSVDTFCKRKAAEDIDYPAIEAQLLPALPKLLKGVPTSAWMNVIEAQYDMLKQAASTFRRPTPAVDTNSLRATGSASPRQAPGSMHEAMWGTPAPRA